MNEFMVIGPPGTGKTTYLARQAQRAVGRFGTHNVVITSLTRAAAAEVAGRDTGIPRQNIGTLHALCYRALERPRIAETETKAFNAAHPELRLSIEASGEDRSGERSAEATPADLLFAQVQLLRERMVPREFWASNLQAFHSVWCEWKEREGVIDFSDLIETALADVDTAPGNPAAIFGDEAQDWSKLEAALMRKWGERADVFVMVGDPDQSIYEWRGADPNIFRQKFPNDTSGNPEPLVLSRSYRVPRRVHEIACTWIKGIADRDPVIYLPRDADGAVERLSANINTPEMLLPSVKADLAAGRSVMVLTSCGYMLEPIKLILRREGVPFHNPYRRSRGDWNPFGPSKGVSARQRLIAFLSLNSAVWGDGAHPWSAADMAAWCEHVKADLLLIPGAKKRLDAGGMPDEEAWGLIANRQDLLDGWEASTDGRVEWLYDRLLESKRRLYDYPMNVFRRSGGGALRAEPRLVIGTIHSVKGGEADVVYLFPDLSRAYMQDWIRPDRSASIIRLFYVAMTRAREKLVLCAPSSSMAVTL